MDKSLKKLIQRYEVLRMYGEEDLKRFEVGTKKHDIQKTMNTLWKIFLTDLKRYAEEIRNENSNRS